MSKSSVQGAVLLRPAEVTTAGQAREPRRLRGAALATVIVSVLLACLFVEGLARLFFPSWAPRTGRVTQFWQFDARYGWAHVPGSVGEFESYGIRAPVVINGKGFRGPEIAYARTPGLRRAVILGDSFVWGFGVPETEMFVTKLQSRLSGVELVNLGVSGYGTDQELLLYRDEGRKYDADLVVVIVAVNDLANILDRTVSAIYGKPLFTLDASGRLTLTNQPVRETPWLKRHIVRAVWNSYVLTRFYRLVLDLRTPHIEGLQREESRAFPRSAAERLLVRLLETLQRDVAADGSQLLVALVDGFGAQGDEIAAYLGAEGIEVVCLDKAIDADNRHLHLPDGFHWNAAGHDLAAGALLGPMAGKLGVPVQEP
jgi:lysophospholipase L1-like esterase